MKILNYPQFSNLSESEDERSYTFDELSPEAKKHAMDSNRDYNTESYDWWEPIIEGFTEEMEAIGMADIDCQFSGFYSQGDGASFTGKVKDNELFLKEIGITPASVGLGDKTPRKFDTALASIAENIYITIQRNDRNHYHHNTISANVEVDGDEEIELDLGLGMIIEIDVNDVCERIDPIITDWAREKSKGLYNSLETYHDELTSDETIAEDLRSGGHTFDEDGNML
jgi:hypothetical protein